MTDIYSKPVMVDPPSGWKYGFPKLYDQSKEEGTMLDWLVREGYPQSEIDRYDGQLYCSFWYPEEEKATDTLNKFFGKKKQKTEDFHERFNEPS